MTLTTKDVAVRPFDEQDEHKVLDVLQAAFGTWSGGVVGVERSELFRWKHRTCPFGASTSVVAVVEEEIVGFLAWLPWLLRAGTQTLRTMRVVDLAVHPDYRRRGAAMALIREGRRYVPEDVAFTWANPNELSYPRALKSGQGAIGPLPRFVGLPSLRRETPLRAWRQGCDAAQPQPQIEAATAARLLGEGVDLQPLPLQLSSPVARLTTAVDAPYLKWRYGRFDEYRAVRAGAEGASGIAIFKVCSRRRFRFSQVCELLVHQNDYRAMRRLLKCVRRAAPVDFLSCAFASRRDALRCGFVPVGGGAVLTVRPIHSGLAADPTRRASWALSFGDLELV